MLNIINLQRMRYCSFKYQTDNKIDPMALIGGLNINEAQNFISFLGNKIKVKLLKLYVMIWILKLSKNNISVS